MTPYKILIVEHMDHGLTTAAAAHIKNKYPDCIIVESTSEISRPVEMETALKIEPLPLKVVENKLYYPMHKFSRKKGRGYIK